MNAQRNSSLIGPKQQFELGKKFYSDIYVLPEVGSDSVKIVIVFRISYQTLTFIKTNSNGNEKYISIPNIEVEFKDNDGIVRKRIFSEDTIVSNNYEESVSSVYYFYGLLTTKMKTGKYNVTAFLRCANSHLLRNKVFKLMEFKNFNKEKIISEPILTTAFQPDKGYTVNTYIMDLGIPFSSEGASILVPVTYENEFEKFKYTLKYTKPKEKYFDWGDDFNLSGSVVPIKNSTITFDLLSSKENLNATIIPNNSTVDNIRNGLLNINISSDKLVPGNYELNIVRENTKDTLKRIISVLWEDMPFSLSDPEFTVEAMYYILTDEIYEKIKEGKSQEVSKKILDYWKEKDPTKTTAFNEAMAEYFKRVDYAMSNFKSKATKNGVKSDMGKIYILYGKPTKIEKTLGEKQNTEVWKYEKIKKEFKFKTESSGNYILESVNDIN
jgi:GWxTD domain-containing protein